MELQVAVELGDDLDGGDGEGGNIIGAGAAAGAAATAGAGAGAGRARAAAKRGRGRDVVAARTSDNPLRTGSKAATRLALGIPIHAGEAREAEATIVEVGRTSRDVTPRETTLLLRVALVVCVAGAVEAGEVVEALQKGGSISIMSDS